MTTIHRDGLGGLWENANGVHRRLQGLPPRERQRLEAIADQERENQRVSEILRAMGESVTGIRDSALADDQKIDAVLRLVTKTLKEIKPGATSVNVPRGYAEQVLKTGILDWQAYYYVEPRPSIAPGPPLRSKPGIAVIPGLGPPIPL